MEKKRQNFSCGNERFPSELISSLSDFPIKHIQRMARENPLHRNTGSTVGMYMRAAKTRWFLRQGRVRYALGLGSVTLHTVAIRMHALGASLSVNRGVA